EPAVRAGAGSGQNGSLSCSSGHDLVDAVASPQAQQVGCGAAADVGEAHVEQQGRVTVAPGPCPNRERTCVSARPAKAVSKRSQYSRLSPEAVGTKQTLGRLGESAPARSISQSSIADSPVSDIENPPPPRATIVECTAVPPAPALITASASGLGRRLTISASFGVIGVRRHTTPASLELDDIRSGDAVGPLVGAELLVDECVRPLKLSLGVGAVVGAVAGGEGLGHDVDDVLSRLAGLAAQRVDALLRAGHAFVGDLRLSDAQDLDHLVRIDVIAHRRVVEQG